MRTGRTVALVLVGLALTGTLFGATVAMGADRTALDSEYTTATFENEGVYAEITQNIQRDMGDDIDQMLGEKPIPRGITLTRNGEEIAQQGVTEQLVGAEMGRTLEELYRYLHGSRGDLNITIDLAEMKASVSETIVDGIEIDTPLLVGSKSDQVEEERIAKLSESESAYQEARLDLSSEEQAALSDELEANVRVELSDEDEALTDAVLAHQQTVLDGLTGELSHEAYVEQLAADEQRIKAEIAASAVADVPTEESVFREDEDPEAVFGPFRTTFQWGSTAAWLLPLLAIGLIGAGYGLTRSGDRTAILTAAGSLVAGIAGVVVGLGGRELLVNVLEPADPGPTFDGLAGVVEGTMRAIALQSAVLAVVGCLLFVAVYADRKGKLRPAREAVGVGPRTGATTEPQQGEVTPKDGAPASEHSERDGR